MIDLISIIVTSYNHAEFLDQRMESLLHQTYKNTEIIVIDDCSTDDSVRILKTYAKYPHVRLKCLNKNQGYANACNLGVSMSSGDYIMFAECDDYDEPEHIEVLMGHMHKAGNVGVAFCSSNMVDDIGRVSGTDFQYREKAFKKCCAQDTLIRKEDMQKFFLISCVIPNMSAALIRKKYFHLTGGFSMNYRGCADWDFWCRIAECCDFFYVAKPLNNFRTHRTTVRSTFGIVLQVSEIYSLLYRSMSKLSLTGFELFRFRVNMGFIWANYITSNPIEWICGFLPIWRASRHIESANILYLSLGLCKKFIYIIRNYAIRCLNRNYAIRCLNFLR